MGGKGGGRKEREGGKGGANMNSRGISVDQELCLLRGKGQDQGDGVRPEPPEGTVWQSGRISQSTGHMPVEQHSIVFVVGEVRDCK